MFYTVYKTTNLINGKFYIGTHKTSDPNDSYLGSGNLLCRAIEKYGRDNFRKDVMFIFDNPADMFAKEAELVSEEFLAENNTYNLKLGGEGGFDWINSNPASVLKKNQNLNGRIVGWRHIDHDARKKALRTRLASGRFTPPSFKGRKHSDEAKRRIGERSSLAMTGEGNSQYGTIWITDGKMARKVPRDILIPEGWRKGRKMNWS